MPRPYMKIIVISLLFVASNYLSYDLGYVDGVRDIIHNIRELQEDIRQQRSIDPAVKRIMT